MITNNLYRGALIEPTIPILDSLHKLTHLITQLHTEAGLASIPTLQMRKLRHRMLKQL